MGVRKDIKMATMYFNLTSQSGNVLVEMHATGTGTLRSCSCPTAVDLYKNVAERGKWVDKLMDSMDSWTKTTEGAGQSRKIDHYRLKDSK